MFGTCWRLLTGRSSGRSARADAGPVSWPGQAAQSVSGAHTALILSNHFHGVPFDFSWLRAWEKNCVDPHPREKRGRKLEPAVQRVGRFASKGQSIFVEGHSQDDTWVEIERGRGRYCRLDIRAVRQSGRGKGNAVREGFAIARGDLLMILDADLTMPPEELEKFYEVAASGKGDFANGVRLVYPMEGEAMQFCNMVANKLFGYAFTWLLGQPVKDTLSGTKVLPRRDYEKIVRHRIFFGDFDPFRGFDLLFGASKQHLKIVDVPIRYRDRRYWSTDIQRWRHGLLLLRMVWFAAGKIDAADMEAVCSLAQHNIEIHENRRSWVGKPVLQKIYRGFHRQIARACRHDLTGLTVEIGSGLGQIKTVIPDCITTNVLPNPWLDQTENAYRLSFGNDSVADLILFDVWHHLRYPGTALMEFQRVLSAGGRLIIFDPS